MKVNNRRLYHGLTILALTLLASTISGMEHVHGQEETGVNWMMQVDLRHARDDKEAEIKKLMEEWWKRRLSNGGILGLLGQSDRETAGESDRETDTFKEKLEVLCAEKARLDAEVERQNARLETERQQKRTEMMQITCSCMSTAETQRRVCELREEIKDLDEAIHLFGERVTSSSNGVTSTGKCIKDAFRGFRQEAKAGARVAGVDVQANWLPGCGSLFAAKAQADVCAARARAHAGVFGAGAEASVHVAGAKAGIEDTPLNVGARALHAGAKANVELEKGNAKLEAGAALLESNLGPFGFRVGAKVGIGLENGIPVVDLGPVSVPVCSIM